MSSNLEAERQVLSGTGARCCRLEHLLILRRLTMTAAEGLRAGRACVRAGRACGIRGREEKGGGDDEVTGQWQN